MVFKIQKAIHPPEGDLLIYDKERRFRCQTPMTEHMRQLFRGEFKIYVEGYIDDRAELQITKILSEQQDW